ncbi:cohesin domain-containing protein [Methanolobus psychrotolerans]|uniref:cohesin domain-containing protein n=1 Tax=Methanolobus psychrotolerans TaxID=1874706 RepID=UPI000B91B7A8|nr:cohesin domain-containing protein [Methanolobus psychrotolerans]
MWCIDKYVKYSVLALLILMAGIGNVSAISYVVISPESQTGMSPGDAFNVNIDVNSGIDPLRAVQIKLVYDSNSFEVASIKDGNLFGSNFLIGPDSGDNGAGSITYSIASTDKSYTPKANTMLTINFHIKDIAEEGTYSLSFEEVWLLDKNSQYLNGKATGSTVVVGAGADDLSTQPESIDFGSVVKSTSTSSTSSSFSSLNSGQQLEYTYVFGSHPPDYEVMSRYGAAQKDANWSRNSLILESRLVEELEGQYLYSYGRIISIGSNSGGYLVVVFYEPLMPDRSQMDEVYTIIDNEAQEMGIENVPVEFGEGTLSQVSDVLQQLLQRIQTINEAKLEDLMDNKSSLYDPMILATAGTVPQIRTEQECWQWYFQDSYAISLNVSDEIDSYLKSGVLRSTGLSPNGYFEVRINEEADVSRKSLIVDIYEIMNIAAMNIGVSDVPVVFKLSNPDETENVLASTQEIPVEEATMPETEAEAKEVPGFGFLISFLSVCMTNVFVKRKP